MSSSWQQGNDDDEERNMKMGVASFNDEDIDEEEAEDYRRHVEMLQRQISDSSFKNECRPYQEQQPSAMPHVELPPAAASLGSDYDDKALYREQLNHAQDVVGQQHVVQKLPTSNNEMPLQNGTRAPRASRPGAIAVAGPPPNHIPLQPTGIVQYAVPNGAVHVPVLTATSVERLSAALPESSRNSNHNRDGAPPGKKRKRTWCLGAIAAFCVLALAAGFAGYQISKNNSNHSKNGSSSSSAMTTTNTINGLTQFDAITTDCSALARQSNPNVVSQCRCTGTISHLASDIVDHYQYLLEKIASPMFSNVSNIPISSCHIYNQALLWLASGDGGSPAGTRKSKSRQRYILAIIYLFWDGPTWPLTDTVWLTAADECTWFGISCSFIFQSNDDHFNMAYQAPTKDVTGLIFKYFNLTGQTIPSEVGILTRLENLDLSLTGLSGTIPDELFDSRSLKVLDLSDNDVSGTIPTQIGQLDQLERLFLSKTGLSGSIPPETCNCTMLQVINMESNRLNGTVPQCLRSMQHLTSACFINDKVNVTSAVPCNP